jgi:hypothetical protein
MCTANSEQNCAPRMDAPSDKMSYFSLQRAEFYALHWNSPTKVFNTANFDLIRPGSDSAKNYIIIECKRSETESWASYLLLDWHENMNK